MTSFFRDAEVFEELASKVDGRACEGAGSRIRRFASGCLRVRHWRGSLFHRHRAGRTDRCVALAVSHAVQIISDPVLDWSGATIGCRTVFIDISETKQLENKLRLLSEAGPALTSSLDSAAILDAVARIAVPALAGLCMVDVLGESGEIERPLVAFADPSRQKLLARRLKQLTPSPDQTIQAHVIESSEPVLLPELSDQVRERIIRHHAHPDAMRAAGIRSLIVVPLFARGRTFGALTLAAVTSHERYSLSDLQLAQDLATRSALAMDNARLYVEAQNAIAARDTIVALVSHDLKNPLSVIFMTAARMLKVPGGRTGARRAASSSSRCIVPPRE